MSAFSSQLAEFDDLLPLSFTINEALRSVANFMSARVADLCVVFVAGRAKSPELAAASRTNPHLAQAVEKLLRRTRGLTPMEGVCEVMKSGEPKLYESVAPLAAPCDAEDQRVIQDAAIRSAMIVPLKAERSVIGALMLAATKESERSFSPQDLAEAEGLARAAALLIEGARDYAEVRAQLLRLTSTLAAGGVGAWEWHIPSGRMSWFSRLETFPQGASERRDGAYEGTYEDLLDRIHPLDRPRIEQSFAHALEHGSCELEFRARGPDREAAWFFGRGAVAERDSGGEPVVVRGICMDVTDRRRAEQGVREAKQRLEGIVRASPLPIVSMDVDGRVVDWNEAAERLTGWTRDMVLGELNPMFPEARDERDELLFRRMQRGESLQGVVVRRRRRDGSLIDLSKWTSPLTDEDGNVKGFLAIYADVTDRIRFLDIAAHELGNPLSSIKAMVSLVRLYVQRGFSPEKILEQIERLNVEVDRFTNLLDDMITTFKTHEGQLPVKRQPVDVCEVVQGSAARVARDTRFVEFNAVAGADGRAVILGDATRLGQVFDNLISNAFKYSPQGSPVRVDVQVADGHVLVSVVDQGVGISSSEMPLIFQEFYRGTADGMANVGGMGLGLYICREIILQHDGHIWAESKVGVGSTFYVKLPLAPPAVHHCQASA